MTTENGSSPTPAAAPEKPTPVPRPTPAPKPKPGGSKPKPGAKPMKPAGAPKPAAAPRKAGRPKPGSAPGKPKASAGAGKVDADRKLRQASLWLRHLADPTRCAILRILGTGPQDVGSIVAQLGGTQPAISHHLALLRHGEIVEPTRDGKFNRYALTPRGMQLREVIEKMAAVAS